MLERTDYILFDICDRMRLYDYESGRINIIAWNEDQGLSVEIQQI